VDIGSLVIRVVGDNNKFTNMMRDTDSKLGKLAFRATQWGRAMTLGITAPLLALGLAAVRSVKGVQAALLTRDLNLLARDVRLLGADFGKYLIPPLRMVVQWVRIGIQWIRSLSEEKKKWVVIIGAVAAAMGPLLFILGSLAPAISLLVSGFVGLFTVIAPGLVAVGTFALYWGSIAAITAVVVVGLGLVADGLLNLFGIGNLGLIEMVNNFKVAGISIGSIMQLGWLEVFKGWEEVRFKIEAGLLDLKATFEKVVDGWGKKFAEFAKKTTGNRDTVVDLKGWINARNGLFVKAQEDLAKQGGFATVPEAEIRLQAREKERRELEKKHAQKIADLNAAEFSTMMEDKLGKKSSGVFPDLLAKFPELLEKLKSLLPSFDFKLPKLDNKMPIKTAATLGAQMSLSRFKLDTSQSLLGAARNREQNVTDKSVLKQLVVMTDVMRLNKGFAGQATVLG
jgi:hypothetical protein